METARNFGNGGGGINVSHTVYLSMPDEFFTKNLMMMIGL
jgi:hypothetical protein